LGGLKSLLRIPAFLQNALYANEDTLAFLEARLSLTDGGDAMLIWSIQKL
jgi:hypothetical protein